jgi:hypothetical protein
MGAQMVRDYRWEYSPLAALGDFLWKRAVDPVLRVFAKDELALFRRTRGAIQIILFAAVVFVPAALFGNAGHLLTASGLLFDIAGALRLFVFDEITGALRGFEENKYGNLPSVAMRELVMPEAGPYDADADHISIFYYKKRGILFLFIGFVLQMIGDLAWLGLRGAASWRLSAD